MKCGNSMRHVLEGESDAVKVLDATLLICNHSQYLGQTLSQRWLHMEEKKIRKHNPRRSHSTES